MENFNNFVSVIMAEESALKRLSENLDQGEIEKSIDSLLNRHLVIFSGVGKSGHVGRKLASSFTSLGTKSIFMHPTEAAHGDMGLVGRSCALVALSRSGNAIELIPLADRAHKNGCPIILISENIKDSILAKFATSGIRLPEVSEAWGHAPTTSTIMQMAVGDALAVCLAIRSGFTVKDFKETHPGGVLGK